MEPDILPSFARADLERLKLAAEVILSFAADDVLPGPLEAELVILRDRLDHTLLLPPSGSAAAPAAGGQDG
jgi:hypothetical protein